MKTLANCTLREFLTQTAKIKRAVEKWLTDTDIMNIRRRMPHLDENIPEAEKKKAYERQARENVSAMFDAICEDHPDETAELIALCCFTEPERVDERPMIEYLQAVTDMIGNEAVIGFFTSLMRLVQTGILTR